MNRTSRDNAVDTLLFESKQAGITNDNFLACTLILAPEQTQSINEAKEAFKSLNIDAVGVAEYQLTKAGGYHIHFVTKKEKTEYLLKRGVHIINGYFLQGWLWYLTKNTTSIQITTKEQNESLAECTTVSGATDKRNEQKGIFVVSLKEFLNSAFDKMLTIAYIFKAPT